MVYVSILNGLLWKLTRLAAKPSGPNIEIFDSDGMNKVDQLSDQITADVPDWTRETPRQFWDPGRKLLLAIRRYQMWRNKTGFVAVSLCKLLVIRHGFLECGYRC
jgi:hypothetical protein